MQFKDFSQLVKQQFSTICQYQQLYKSSVTGDALWDLYLGSFKPKDNPIFRDPNSSSHNDNLDKNFIRRYGNIVAINENNEIVTMWDIALTENSEYYLSAKAMSNALKTNVIQDVFFETYSELNILPYEKVNKTQPLYRLGIAQNHKQYTKEEVAKFGVVEEGKVYQFNHFHIDLPTLFVDKSGSSQATIIGNYRDAKNVFGRGLSEISLDTLELVSDLIKQGSLLDGQTHLYKVEKMIVLKKQYNQLASKEVDNWLWKKSYGLKEAKFRNELIGTLCVDLTEGKEINESCQTWNKRVDPANYMKATAPISKRQIEEAQKFVEENGYTDSFNRRFATIDDINVNDIVHSNIGNGVVKPASIFDKVKPAKSTQHKKSEFKDIEEVTIDKFIKDILPGCTSVEAFFENRMSGNLVSLTTSNVLNSKPLFKWNNNFSWTFNGNLAGKSLIKENVKAIGGKTTGAVRCSLQWNDPDTRGIIDLDLHCIVPSGFNVYYGNRNHSDTSTWLDVDMRNPPSIGIENITIDRLIRDGVYLFKVRNYSGHTKFNGFKAEIEFGGETFEYFVPNSFVDFKSIAQIVVKNGEVVEIRHNLDPTTSSKNIWNLDTNQFHKVNLVCLSPNHWADNNIGNKHYLFMINNCKSDVPLRSFHIENLTSDLLEHRKVLEVLGQTTMLNPADKQLAGLGFNATIGDELIVRLQGTFKRQIKIKF